MKDWLKFIGLLCAVLAVPFGLLFAVMLDVYRADIRGRSFWQVLLDSL